MLNFCWAPVHGCLLETGSPAIALSNTTPCCGRLNSFTISLTFSSIQYVSCPSKSFPTSNYTNAVRIQWIGVSDGVSKNHGFIAGDSAPFSSGRSNEYGVVSVNGLLCIASGFYQRRAQMRALFWSARFYKVKHSESVTAVKCWPWPQEWQNQTKPFSPKAMGFM